MLVPASQHIGAYSIGLGPTEILLLVILAIILFAPRKLPELAKALRESADILRREAGGGEEAGSEPPAKPEGDESEKALREIAEKLQAEEKKEKKKRRLF